jgi:hypothetical protein
VWYQKRFLPPTAAGNELFYRDLSPGFLARPTGHIIRRKELRRLGFDYCFAEPDLYTLHFGAQQSTEMERLFFGAIDFKGKKAVEYIGAFEHPSACDSDTFTDLMAYLTTQKMRTPKGLLWLERQARSRSRSDTLEAVTRLRNVYGAIWSECVWQIADATNSATKFIVSDHPVTVYNRGCSPLSWWCKTFWDPDIRRHASHTIFPLSLDRILIMTNLSWVRNPYQHERGTRPNPRLSRETRFYFPKIQTRRVLAEQEVRQINFVLKARAWRYIGAANSEWLYPEELVSVADWRAFGDGELLMPDPRAVHMGGDIKIGYGDGRGESFDEYGQRPWEPDPDKDARYERESRALYRHQGEFARRHGPYRRGRGWQDKERDTDSLHEYFVSLGEDGRSSLPR